MYKSGDVVICNVQFTDTYEVKNRPALVLYEDMSNLVVAGITSNKNMKGIKLTKSDGAIVDSVIKTNYIFTISSNLIKKKVFTLNQNKRKEVYDILIESFSQLVN